MALTTEQQILIEQRVTNEAKSTGAAYLIWFFLGGLGVHRFYLGHTRSGTGLLVLTLAGVLLSAVGVGFVLLLGTAIWVLVDAFLIPGMVAEHKNKVREGLIRSALVTG
jgi:Predicted membrane protein